MEFDIDDELPDRESGKRIDLIFRINEKKTQFVNVKLNNSIKNMIRKKLLAKVCHQSFENV